MREAAAFRGEPLLVFAGVLCAWFGLRVVLWQPSPDSASFETLHPAGTAVRGLARLPREALEGQAILSDASGPATASFNLVRPLAIGPLPAPPVRLLPAVVPRPPGVASYPAVPVAQADFRWDPVRSAVGHSLVLAAGLSQVELASPLTTYLHLAPRPRAGIPAAAPLLTGLRRHALLAGSRVSADAWLMVRDDTTAPVASGRPSYGRSQAGGVVRYRLAGAGRHGPLIHLRASSALQGALEKDLAAGFSTRPAPELPLRLAVEARVTETRAGTELRPAAVALTEFPPLHLPRGVRAEAYIQAGYVGGRFATAFVDGQGRVEGPIAQRGQTEVTVGAGAWGGAQKGAGRLDVGPTAVASFRLGGARGRVAADYRFRVAGDAEPRSGPALTLSAGF